jgi:hypothetical protein
MIHARPRYDLEVNRGGETQATGFKCNRLTRKLCLDRGSRTRGENISFFLKRARERLLLSQEEVCLGSSVPPSRQARGPDPPTGPGPSTASSRAPKSGRTHLGPSKPFPSPSGAQGTGPSERTIPQYRKVPALAHRGLVQVSPASSETELSPALDITMKVRTYSCGPVSRPAHQA